MEKAKTRSRAKAVPSDAPTGDKQPDQPVLPPPSLPVPGIEATPAKKPRKTKKKKNDEATTTMAEAAPMAPPPVVEVPPTTSQQQQQPAEASQTAETKKRGKRLKATEIVAQIEQQEHPEESAIVSMLMEESTKLEETPTKKAKKGGPGRKGRKKQEQQPPLETPIVQPVVVEEPKTAVVVEQVPPPSSAIKKTKKRGRKPAAAAAAPEQKEEEAVVQVEVAVAAEQPSTVTAEAPVVVQESAAGATLLQVPSPIHTRTRTRTRTNTNPVPLTRPALNTTQDLPNKEPSPATVDQTHPQSDADAVKSHHDEQSSGESKTMSQDEAGNGQAKSKVGGARIVRPKETVTVVKTTAVVNAETSVPVEVEKKVVEIVRREAGPRIVKPPEAIIQEQLLAEKKRKLLEQNDHVNKVVKKLKEKAETAAAKKAEKLAAAAAAATAASSTVVVPVAETNEPKPETKKETAPDFKSIHQKEASKMESIVDFQKRLHKRHMTLNGADATANKTAATAGTTMATSVRGGGGESNMAAKVRSPSQSAVSRMPKPVVVTKETPNKQNKHEEPVVKVTKKLAMPSPLKVNNNNNNNVLSTQSSNIPVFISKPTKETKQVETKSDAKTPKPYVRRPKTSTADNVENVMAAMSKTPRAAKVMTASSVLAPKTPVNQTGKPVGQENLLRSAQKNGQASQQGTGTTIPPQLATSSFIRRKSFDLNASLSRRLAYKPYIGKLKPIETAKPAATGATAVCLSTTRHNLNCTKYN